MPNYVFCQGFNAPFREYNPVLPRMKRIEEKHHRIVLPEPDAVALVMAAATGMIADIVRVAVATGAMEEELCGAMASPDAPPTSSTGLRLLESAERR